MQQKKNSKSYWNNGRPKQHPLSAPPHQKKDEAEYGCSNRAGIRKRIDWRNRFGIEHKMRDQQNRRRQQRSQQRMSQHKANAHRLPFSSMQIVGGQNRTRGNRRKDVSRQL